MNWRGGAEEDRRRVKLDFSTYAHDCFGITNTKERVRCWGWNEGDDGGAFWRSNLRLPKKKNRGIPK